MVSIPIASWLHQMGRTSLCLRCKLVDDFWKHCYHSALLVWTGIFRVFSFVSLESFIMTWDASLWGRACGAFALYEAESKDRGFLQMLKAWPH